MERTSHNRVRDGFYCLKCSQYTGYLPQLCRHQTLPLQERGYTRPLCHISLSSKISAWLCSWLSTCLCYLEWEMMDDDNCHNHHCSVEYLPSWCEVQEFTKFTTSVMSWAHHTSLKLESTVQILKKKLSGGYCTLPLPFPAVLLSTNWRSDKLLSLAGAVGAAC